MKNMKIWYVKIGGCREIPYEADGPMRSAVQLAYEILTGEGARFCFSGWGAELTEKEQALVDLDDYKIKLNSTPAENYWREKAKKLERENCILRNKNGTVK
jgi:hypothetical protein